MAFLDDHCFSVGADLMPLPNALDRLKGRLVPVVGIEEVPLGAATGRILAPVSGLMPPRGLVAPRNVPPFDNAALDGYAMAGDNLNPDAETRMKIAGLSRAGIPMEGPLPPGTAAQIFTGAPMPEGSDTVVMFEDTRRDGDAVVFPAGVRTGANVRPAGEDMKAGDEVLAAGRRLRPQDVGVAAATGTARVAVYERLRVALFSTGNELFEPGGDLPPGGIYDINRYLLRGVLEGWGFDVTDHGILPDDPDQIAAALLEMAMDHHVLLSSGGASTSTEDHVVRAARALGTLDFWRMAIKPGRPMAFGQLGRAVYVGLPGNPVAATVCLLRIARPALFRLAGADWLDPVGYPLPAGFSMTKKAGRREFLRATPVRKDDGRLVVERFGRQGSGILTSLSGSAGLVELEEPVTEVREGQSVTFLPYADLLA